MVTPNDPTLVVSSKACQSAQTRKISEHIQFVTRGREIIGQQSGSSLISFYTI